MVFKVQLWVYYRLTGSNTEMPESQLIGNFSFELSQMYGPPFLAG